ncbi:protein JASON-like isoform X2 [Arachis stenosperma]|uniref:protein JASON-like isoform X2 n=1 Tax=Arachis stenosperma TaxID=217475 RepID=UPI0025ACF158|nr:protein JASON-like isoform X2 [Arachis stenosperma]
MRWLGLILRFVFRSFYRATMGSFFSCFRGRDNRHLPTTATAASTAALSRQSKTNDAVVSRNRLSTLFLSEVREESACNEGKSFGAGAQIHDKGHKDEAMFLKASEKLKVSPSCGKDSEPSRFHSWHPNTSADKVRPDNQPFNPPTPKKCSEDWGKRTDSLEQTPSSCISNTQNTRRDSLDSSEGSKTGNLHASGTVFETAQSQFRYPKQALNEKSKKVLNENESKVEESLSSWLKPASVILEERNRRMEMANSHIRKAPSDRPIIGMVAAHWTEDEESHFPPPKWWDGNGIPNSTNKYKEDQKVNWHATPFEERLEKALSEESSISQRKDFCVKPIAFNENEENDTAVSQFQSSPHPQSVVSF